MKNIKDIIEQGEKEFQKKFYDFCESDSGSIHWEILDWHKKEQHKLLQSIVEMIPKEKPMNTFSFVLKGEELELYMQHKGFNQCRADLKAKLTINIKE